MPVQVEPSVGRTLLDAVLAEPTMQITIDIEQGTLEAFSARIETTFPLDEFTRAAWSTGGTTSGSPSGTRMRSRITSRPGPRGSRAPADRSAAVPASGQV